MTLKGAERAALSSPPPRGLVAAMLTGMVLVPLNSTMIAVGLDSIRHTLGLSLADVVWVVSAYLITMAVVQPLGGKAGDLYGHRRLFLLGVGGFLVGSLLGAAASSLDLLIVARCLQAVGAGVLATNGSAILRRSYPDTLPQVLGNVSLVQSMGAAVGPLLGSLLIARFGWPSIFWINLPVLLTTFVWGYRVLPWDSPTAPHTLDIGGAAAVGAILVSITLALKDLAVWAWLFLPAAVLTGVFLRHERRTHEPVIQLPLFSKPGFVAANFSVLTANAFMYTLLLWTPLYLASHRVPLTTIGVVLLGFSLMSSVASFGGSRLVMHGFFSRGALVRLAFAVDLVALGLAWLLPTGGELANDVLVLLVAGLGAGLGLVAMQATALLAARRTEAGSASGIYSTFRYMGSILASAALAWLLPVPAVYLVVLAGVSLVGLAFSWGYPEPAPTPSTLAM